MAKPEWRELYRETGRKCPKLFYKFVTGEEGYQLFFTDLFALWRADASVEDIQDYAKITRTSIDPSDSTQLNVLLQKLTKSLAEGTNTLRQTEDASTEAVLLSTTIKLPRPLQPLQWDFFLEAKDAADLGETILRPCLHAAAESRKKVESLLEFINAKDRVISKLLEKIEGTSLDLSLVFPGITGVRAKKGYVTLKEAQAHVPGLRGFDLEQWRKGFGAEGPYAGFENDGLYNLVAGNETCSKHTLIQHQKWYAKLPKATATISQAARIDAIRSSSPILNNSDTEDEFETQKKRKPTTKIPSTDTDSEPESGEAKHRKVTDKIRKVPSRASNIPSSPPPISRTDIDTTKRASEDSDATESDSDLDLTVLPKTKPRLAGLGSAKKPSMRKELSRVETSSNYRSSSPLAVQPLAPSPPSSPPIQPPVLRSQQFSRPSQSRTESASSGALKPGRLGGLRTEREAVETPDIEDDDALSWRNEKKEPSTQTTPSRRRFGGLGRANTASQMGSPSRNGSNVVDKMNIDDHAAQDSDASTASTASVPSSPAKRDKTNIADVKHEHDSGSVQINESVPQLSKEEKQSQRREELKRKHLSGQDNPVSNSAPSGGLRKKRKF